ncbi:hypothetical protein HXX76_010085 [Chlamydomonas incerta]|uniref:DSBA-like thioredoxin domain-containing protein n=1 Tax=Chlamydomonas incerta TaxID=51695 RepID=A0A835T2W0_CHLIN|nr:hypothetical protein HXX76_010085 [Chlamydomonas incerta]|eukprot:KAG2430566.1 hypothetical protein HXX76_010085 [Chlamydomonas incerta]
MSICAQASFEVHWVPFSWDANAPKEGVSKWEYFTGVLGAQKLADLLPVASKAYEEEGLSYTLEGLTGCNMDAHRLLAWAAAAHGRTAAWGLLERIYNAYHCQGLYVGSSPEGHVNLLAATERAGLPRAAAAAVLADPRAYLDRVQSDMAAHKGVKAIPRVEIAGRLCMSGCKTVEQYVAAIRAALRDLEHEEREQDDEDELEAPPPPPPPPRRARPREEAVVRLPQPPSAPCPPWPSSGPLTPQPPQPRSGSSHSQPLPLPHPHPPQQQQPQQPRPLAAAGSPQPHQPHQPHQAQGPGQGQGPAQRAAPPASAAATRQSAANPLQQLLQAHAAAAATTSKFQRSSSGPHMLQQHHHNHHHSLSGGSGGGGGGGGGGRPQQASGLGAGAGRQFGSGRHDGYDAGGEGLVVRVTAVQAGAADAGCPSASAPVTWMDHVVPLSPSEGELPSAGAAGSGGGGGGGEGGARPQSPAAAFAKLSDGPITGASYSAAGSPRGALLARGYSDREGPCSAGASSYCSGRGGASSAVGVGAGDASTDGVPSPVGSGAEQPPPRRYRRAPAKGKSLLQLMRNDLNPGGGGGGNVLLGGDRAERVDSAVQVLQMLHSKLLGGGGAAAGGGGGRDLSPSSRSLLADRLAGGVGGSSNRVRDREGALIATALQRKTFRERAAASSDGTTSDVVQQFGLLGVSAAALGDEPSGGGGGGPGRLGRSTATAMGVAGLGGAGAGGGVHYDRVVPVTAPGGPTAAGSGPTLKQSPTGRSLLGVGSTSSHHHQQQQQHHHHHHSPQRAQYDRSPSLGLFAPGGHPASVSVGAAAASAGLPGSTSAYDGGASPAGGGGGGGPANSAPTQATRFSYNGGLAIPGVVGSSSAISGAHAGGAAAGDPGGRSHSPGAQVLRVSLSGRLPATGTQDLSGRAATDAGSSGAAVPPQFASGPLALAAPPPGGGGASVSGGGGGRLLAQPTRLLLSAAAPGGGGGSSNGRDAHSVPLAFTTTPSPVPSASQPQLSPSGGGGGGGASRHVAAGSRSPSGAAALLAGLPAAHGLVLSEVTSTSMPPPPGSPRGAGNAAGSPGPGASTPTGLQSHASNKVVPVTISVSARPPPPALAAPQLLSPTSGAAVALQSPPPPPPAPQPPSQPPQPQPGGGKSPGRVLTLTGSRAAGGGGSVPQVAVASEYAAGPPSAGSGAGRGGAGAAAAAGAATAGSRAVSASSSVGDGRSDAPRGRRKLRSFLPPLLARLFGYDES